jgi:hypothetical protein
MSCSSCQKGAGRSEADGHRTQGVIDSVFQRSSGKGGFHFEERGRDWNVMLVSSGDHIRRLSMLRGRE